MQRRIVVGDAVASITADGNTTAVSWPGGKGTWAALGTFGAGTAKLQWSPNGTTWVDVSSASATADGYANFEIARGKVRTNLSGATGPSLTTYVIPYDD